MSAPNQDLRLRIARMVKEAGEGHIPSSFSIVDILQVLYSDVLRYDALNPRWTARDYFILSKGHGAAALYVVLCRHGFLTEGDLAAYSSKAGILGGHPDVTTVPGVEASTGSLGHGFPMAVGVALGLRIKGLDNRTMCLVGDGECHEGSIWEAANVGANLKLGNLCTIVDWNGSAAQLMPIDDLPSKWRAFGWDVYEVDGHSPSDLSELFRSLSFAPVGQPKAVIAHTTKGRGVSFMEGHGRWHHRVPNDDEWREIEGELT